MSNKQNMDNKQLDRVMTTISCKDCDDIPKVRMAGEVEGNLQYMHNGIKIHTGCYHGSWMTKIIKELKGHHEPQEEKVFHEVLNSLKKEKPIMIELGSFWAYYSMWFKHKTNGKTIMVEPVPEKYNIGVKNFELNRMNGSFINACIGSKYIKNYTFVDWDRKKYQTSMMNIERICNDYNLNFIDILHSDIQGTEYDMLLGAEAVINRIHYVFISTHRNKHDKCVNFLESNNFHIVVEHAISQSYSVDGLIVGRNKKYGGVDKVKISKSNN